MRAAIVEVMVIRANRTNIGISATTASLPQVRIEKAVIGTEIKTG